MAESGKSHVVVGIIIGVIIGVLAAILVLKYVSQARTAVGLTSLDGSNGKETPPPPPPVTDDEDRPPIIIANGSIDIKTLFGGLGDSRGKWIPESSDPATAKIWHH